MFQENILMFQENILMFQENTIGFKENLKSGYAWPNNRPQI